LTKTFLYAFLNADKSSRIFRIPEGGGGIPSKNPKRFNTSPRRRFFALTHTKKTLFSGEFCIRAKKEE